MSQAGSIVKRGTKWTAIYRAPDPATGRTKQVWKTFATKKDAQAFLRRQLVALEDGTHVRYSRETVREYFEGTWLPHVEQQVTIGKLRKTTANQYTTQARLHVIPRIGGIKLTALDAPALNKLYADLLTSGRLDGRGGLSPATVHLVHVTISRSLRDAVRTGKLARNIAQNAEPPSAKSVERDIWTSEQLRRFLDFTKAERLHALWLLMSTSGIRRAEAAGLKWDAVDLDAGEISIRETRVTVNYVVSESTPKTDKGRRLIALDPLTVTALRRHRAAQLEERLRWGASWTDSGLVFTKEDGSGLHPEFITKGMVRVVARSGLPRLTPHGIRHSYATSLRDAGVPLETVSKRLGHASITITADLYQHRTDESDRAAAEAGALRIIGGAS